SPPGRICARQRSAGRGDQILRLGSSKRPIRATGWHSSCYTEYNYHSMITFSYQARDASGRMITGIQDALNEDNAVTSLMSRGLMVLSLQKKAIANKNKKRVWTVRETDLVLFTRQLSTMIEAGISLVQALTALYEQSDVKRQ